MIYCIEQNGNNFEIDIRLPTEQDFDGLVALNQRWQIEVIEDISNGYLSADFNGDTFRKLADNKELVLGSYKGEIISYYLLNNISTERIVLRHQQFIKTLKEKNLLPDHFMIGMGAQALVDKAFQGSALRRLMLDHLVKGVADKYDCLFSTIQKKNPRAFYAHAKDGWRLVYEDAERYHVMLDLGKYEVTLKNS